MVSTAVQVLGPQVIGITLGPGQGPGYALSWKLKY